MQMTVANRPQMDRVNRRRPCPCCQHDTWCLVAADGSVALCMRIKSDKPKTMKDGTVAYLHAVSGIASESPSISSRKRESLTDLEKHTRLAPQVRRWFNQRGDSVKVLAASMGVSECSLVRLRVGRNASELCWTFPEQNHRGMVVGCNRRFFDGKKMAVAGFGRGLTYSDDWFDAPGPLLLVEGGSDVAAGLTLGCCVMGRPSNVGGVNYLAKMLRDWPRPIVVVGERDAKPSDGLPERHDPQCDCCGCCWPGKHGAIQTANVLSKRLERLVQWSLLPNDAKDLRGWLNKQRTRIDNTEAMHKLGAILGRKLFRGIKR